jgi:hypothetical protein
MWQGADRQAPFRNLRDANFAAFEKREAALMALRPQLEAWQPGRERKQIFDRILDAQASLHGLLVDIQSAMPTQPILPGLDLREGASFSVSNLRLARRTGGLGEFRNEMVVEIVQSHRPDDGASTGGMPERGGATLIVDLSNWDLRYIIYKRLYAHLPDQPGDGTGQLSMRLSLNETGRAGTAGESPRQLWQGEDDASPASQLARAYGPATPDTAYAIRRMRREPFRMLHHLSADGQQGGPA